MQDMHRMRQLAHPYVLTCFGVCEDVGSASLVLEYAENQSLRSVLLSDAAAAAAGAPLQWNMRKRLQFVADACLGLQYLHDQEIFHGNLKSSNVLIDRDTRPKLTARVCRRSKRGCMYAVTDAI